MLSLVVGGYSRCYGDAVRIVVVQPLVVRERPSVTRRPSPGRWSTGDRWCGCGAPGNGGVGRAGDVVLELLRQDPRVGASICVTVVWMLLMLHMMLVVRAMLARLMQLQVRVTVRDGHGRLGELLVRQRGLVPGWSRFIRGHLVVTGHRRRAWTSRRLTVVASARRFRAHFPTSAHSDTQVFDSPPYIL